MTKVSIIIPIYNASSYIERCVKSLFTQTYEDIEYIFVDDGSTDKPINLIKNILLKYPQRAIQCKFLKHKHNKGSAITRKVGMLAATGEYMIQVDSDDYVESNYIQLLVERAKADDADVVICDYFITTKTGIEQVSMNINTEDDELISKLIAGEIHNGLWNKLIRRSLITEHQIFPIEGINMYDDKTVSFRVVYYAQKISHINIPLYYYNKTNPNSITAQHKSQEIEPAMRMYLHIRDFCDTCQCNENIRNATNKFLIKIYAMALLYGNKTQIKQLRNIMDIALPDSEFDTSFLSWHYRTVVIFDKHNFNVGVYIVRVCAAIASSIRS